jgi:hypothetical protein
MLGDEASASDLYQVQLLQAFKVVEWDDDKVGRVVDTLYTEMKSQQTIEHALRRLRENSQLAYLIHMGGDDDESIFRLLFGYELFYLTHRCICEMRNNGSISDKSRDALMDKL